MAKTEHLTNPFAPFVGWALWAMRGGIFIDRANRESAFESLRHGIDDARACGATIVIFPDMRRPTPERIAADRAHFQGRIVSVETWLTATLVPRVGGLFQILQALEQMDVPARIVDITNAFGVENNGVIDASRLCGATLHFKASELCPGRPYDKGGLMDWLMASWRRKNVDIDHWRGKNSH